MITLHQSAAHRLKAPAVTGMTSRNFSSVKAGDLEFRSVSSELRCHRKLIPKYASDDRWDRITSTYGKLSFDTIWGGKRWQTSEYFVRACGKQFGGLL